MRKLKDFTNARVDLGRVGDSVPTSELLNFRLAHAKARDAVHLPLDTRSLMQEFSSAGWESLTVTSQAKTREEYLLRPDLGRMLSANSFSDLEALRSDNPILYCVVDGLSAAAIHRHATRLLKELQASSPIIVVTQGRVAIGDQIGELLKAQILVLLIGERPGLSSPDSLGVYITYNPAPGRSDAERNCISNIQDQGLTYEVAAQKIGYLVEQACICKLTGVELKERAGHLADSSKTQQKLP